MNIYDELYKSNVIDYGKLQSLKKTGESTERERAIGEEFKKVLLRTNIPPKAKILEIGASMGFNHQFHSCYTGIEYSRVAVEFGKDRFGSNIALHQGDVTALQFPDEAFDLVVSFSTLEHVPQIEKAFEEILRVLKLGGCAYLAPAWNCRPWTVKKIDIMPYKHLPLSQKFEKFLIPMRDNLLLRFITTLPFRMLDEIKVAFGVPTKLRYRSLSPSINLIEKYGRVPDDDAFISMDSHSAITYFRCKGLEVKSHQSLLRRLLCRGEAVLVHKSEKLTGNEG